MTINCITRAASRELGKRRMEKPRHHIIYQELYSWARPDILFYFILINLFIYLFWAALGLHCCAWAFSSCSKRGWGLLFVVVRGLLIAVASRCRARALGARASVVVARGLQSAGSVVVAHGLSCSMACGIFPDPGSNRCPLHWQADS